MQDIPVGVDLVPTCPGFAFVRPGTEADCKPGRSTPLYVLEVRHQGTLIMLTRFYHGALPPGAGCYLTIAITGYLSRYSHDNE